MFKPEHRPEPVHHLVSGVDRYNPDNVVVLEEYLQTQIDNGTYDHFANLALLKLYQFNAYQVPETHPSDKQEQPRPFTIFQVLLLCLAHQPFGPDFKLALALLSDQMSPAYSAPDILEGYAQLQQLQQLLLSRDLPSAWSKLHSFASQPQVEKAYQSLGQMDDLLRRSIAAEVLQPLFKSVDTARFEAWMGTSQGEAQQVVTLLGQGWTVEGSRVQVPPPASESAAAAAFGGRKDLEDGVKAGKEGLNLQKLSKLLKGA